MPGVNSGLDVAAKVLHKIDDIAFCTLTSRDVVRHPLVQKIVKAYEAYENKRTVQRTDKAPAAGHKKIIPMPEKEKDDLTDDHFC